MGTDIHLRVEYLVPGETVALVDGQLAVVPDGGAPRWAPAEKLTPKEEIHLNQYYLKNLHKPDVKEEWDQMPALELASQDRFYRGRDYTLFGLLAGVRGGQRIWEDRGFPGDASDEVREEYESWGLDAHTPSWQTLDELLAVRQTLGELLAARWDSGTSWFDCLEKMTTLAKEKCGGDSTAVRIIYWFDN